MGWGRTLLLGDIGNRLDIEDCERSIYALRRTFSDQSKVDRSQDDEIRELRRELDDLKLCVGSLTRILIARQIVSESDVTRIANVIDENEIARIIEEGGRGGVSSCDGTNNIETD